MKIDENYFDEVVKELARESDRGCAIVGAVYLDDLLEQVLNSYLIQNKESVKELLSSKNTNAVINSFGAKIELAFGIGLITKEDRRELKIIKSIRNKFAHNLKLKFEESPIVDMCRELKAISAYRVYKNPTSRKTFAGSIGFYGGKLSELMDLMRETGIGGRFDKVLASQVKIDKLKSNAS